MGMTTTPGWFGFQTFVIIVSAHVNSTSSNEAIQSKGQTARICEGTLRVLTDRRLLDHYARSLLRSCIVLAGEDPDLSLEQIVARWIRERIAKNDFYHFFVIIPYNHLGYSFIDDLAFWPHDLAKQCYQLFICSELSLEVASLFVARLVRFQYWNALAIKRNSITAPAETLPHSISCGRYNPEPFCCFCYVYSPTTAPNAFVLGSLLNGVPKGTVNYLYYQEVQDESSNFFKHYNNPENRNSILCASTVVSGLKFRNAKWEQCLLATLGHSTALAQPRQEFNQTFEIERVGNINATLQRLQVEFCYVEQLKTVGVQQLLLHSQLGLQLSANFNFQFTASCRFNQSTITPELHQIEQKSARRVAIVQALISILAVILALALLANGLLLTVIQCSEFAVRKRRPAWFLRNSACANAIYCVAGLMATACLKLYRYEDRCLEPARVLCDKIGSLWYPDTFWNSLSSCTRNATSASSVPIFQSLLIIEIAAYNAGVLNFVAFGVFQLYTLLKPLADSWVTRQPAFVVMTTWIVGILMAVLGHGLLQFEYYSVLRTLGDDFIELPLSKSLDVTVFNWRHQSRLAYLSLDFLKAAGALQLAIGLGLILFGATVYAGILVFLHVAEAKRRAIFANPSAASLTANSKKAMVTIGVAMSVAVCASLPRLAITFLVYYRSGEGEVEEASPGDIYGLEQLFWYHVFHFSASISSAIEPLISPILITCRFDILQRYVGISAQKAAEAIYRLRHRLMGTTEEYAVSSERRRSLGVAIAARSMKARPAF